MKFGLRQTAISAGIFAALLLALVSLDERVRERATELVSGAGNVMSWGDRVSMFTDALATAARYQSIENAPLLVFATVGVVLFLFMSRT
jgi:hypothetical protein